MLARLVRKASGPVVFKMGTVKSVDTDQCTCEVEMVDGTADRPAVQMRAIVDTDDNGMVFFPAKDSQVLVGVINGNINQCFIAMTSKIDSFKIVIDSDNKISADKNKLTAKWKQWQHNDGNYGGMIKLIDPNDPDAGVLSRLNKLEQGLSNHILEYNTHTHASTGSIGTPSPPAAPDTQTISQTQRAQLENKDVTH